MNAIAEYQSISPTTLADILGREQVAEGGIRVIRDIAEVRDMGFAVFARGVVPVPGGKNVVVPLNEPVRCGGVTVGAGDVVVADEEGIVVVQHPRRAWIY